MTNAYTLMTAMPPTIGHKALIQFLSVLDDIEERHIVLTMQPGEPMLYERERAIKSIAEPLGCVVDVIREELPQDPNAPGFWTLWKYIMSDFGFVPGDVVVSSETYGNTLAKVLDGIFVPYDLNREVVHAKATPVRKSLVGNWNQVSHEFKRQVEKRVTIFGAESCGKTTTANTFRELDHYTVLHEWARPYLETVGPELTVEKMDAIYAGQLALQQVANMIEPQPVIVQDTDLFSTYGYWDNWDPGSMPSTLISDALANKSDLYIVMASSVPFTKDQLRYGGDKREIQDDYWIELCVEHDLNYVVIDSSYYDQRVAEAQEHVFRIVDDIDVCMQYDRGGF